MTEKELTPEQRAEFDAALKQTRKNMLQITVYHAVLILAMTTVNLFISVKLLHSETYSTFTLSFLTTLMVIGNYFKSLRAEEDAFREFFTKLLDT
jgi:hypothetical protein